MATDTPAPNSERLLRLWRYGRALAAPLLIWLLLVGALIPPVLGWLQSDQRYDEEAMQEWIEEARNNDKTLADLVQEYVEALRVFAAHREKLDPQLMERPDRGGIVGPRANGQEAGLVDYHDAKERAVVCREQIYQHLRSLGEPVTKMYPGQLPLFPLVYRIEVTFEPKALPPARWLALEGGWRLDTPVVWDSGEDPGEEQYRRLPPVKLRGLATVRVHYQVWTWDKRRRDELIKARRFRQLGLLALAATGLGLAWLLLVQADERERQKQRAAAREQIALVERQRLEAEAQRMETERELLVQRLAREAAERHALELKSHLYASIGIMAGSYAHNIKNLLVRPNDLLRRCLEQCNGQEEQEHMLREVQQTLGTVTERLQQILHTVRRDPSQAKLEVMDLNEVMRDLVRTWSGLAAERWQMDLVLQLNETPAWVAADLSHLQQAVENLLFNARDATFEMRNQLRDAARKGDNLDGPARRQALIAAAAWRGRVVLRVRSPHPEEVWLEVTDNGAGMTEEVRRRCTETHFSTKRDNALYEGYSTGMGLGLSFVTAILEHHRAHLEIESELLRGTTLRARFPAASPVAAEGAASEA
jgi:signal transduction histidine kinase